MRRRLGLVLLMLLLTDARAPASVEDRTGSEAATEMAPFQHDRAGREKPRVVEINGMRWWLAAGHTTQPPAEVRAWYRNELGARSAGVPMAWGDAQVGGVAFLERSTPKQRRDLDRFFDSGDLTAQGLDRSAISRLFRCFRSLELPQAA